MVNLTLQANNVLLTLLGLLTGFPRCLRSDHDAGLTQITVQVRCCFVVGDPLPYKWVLEEGIEDVGLEQRVRCTQHYYLQVIQHYLHLCCTPEHDGIVLGQMLEFTQTVSENMSDTLVLGTIGQ